MADGAHDDGSVLDIVLAVLALPLWATFELYDAYEYSESKLSDADFENTKTLWDEVQVLSKNHDTSRLHIEVVSDAYNECVSKGLFENLPPTYFITQLFYLVEALSAMDGLLHIPPVEWDKFDELTLVEKVKLRNYLRMQKHSYKNFPVVSSKWKDIVKFMVKILFTHLPSSFYTDDEPHGIQVPLISLYDDPKSIVGQIVWLFALKEEIRETAIFRPIRAQLEANLERNKNIFPSNSDCLPEQLVDIYLKGTPFEKLMKMSTPFTIPLSARMEHMHVVAPTGTGKTVLLQGFIQQDLELVIRGEASLIVMESNRDLFKSIERLKVFGKGEPLEGKLVLIDVEDVEYPTSLNLFDLGLGNFDTDNARDKEALRNATTSMLDYIFRALLGAELTSRQSTLFNFAIQLLLEIPNATLDTLIDLMEATDSSDFQKYINQLDRDGQKYFESRFFNSKNKLVYSTKSQVVDRIFAIKRNRVLSNMFSAPKTKLNFFEEMGQGKVILVNASKSLLQEEGVELFGRFILALVLLATEQRQMLPQEQRLPVYFYMDEAQDFIRNDEKLPTILDQARKNKLGMVVAHQRLEQLEPPVLNALMGNTAIKFASNLADTNANTMARNMRTTTDFITRQPKHSFASFVRGVTDAAVSLSIPFIDLSRYPKMSNEDYSHLLDENRRKFTGSLEVVEPVELMVAEDGQDYSVDPDDSGDESSEW